VKDASGSWPNYGVLEGNVMELGDYFSCLETEFSVKYEDSSKIEHGRHCIVLSTIPKEEKYNNKGFDLENEHFLLEPLVGMFGGPAIQVTFHT